MLANVLFMLLLDFSHRKVIDVLLKHGARLNSCSSCKKGKPCAKVKADDLNWLLDQQKILKKAEKGAPVRSLSASKLDKDKQNESTGSSTSSASSGGQSARTSKDSPREDKPKGLFARLLSSKKS